MALKRKNLSEIASNETTALPLSMASIERDGQLHHIELVSLIPAPLEWNFYRPLSENKMLELIHSIKENGLLHPLVVWKRENGLYMILSGHNRAEAYRRLYERTGDEQWSKIPCIVRSGLSGEEAQEMIVDSNWVQRELSPREKVLSISAKYASLGRKKRASAGEDMGRNYDRIANEYGLSGRQVARYVQLSNLSDGMLVQLDTGGLSLRGACKYALLPQSVQQEILVRYEKLPDGDAVLPLKRNMSISQIVEILDNAAGPMAVIQLRVPAHRKDEIESKLQQELQRLLKS